MSKSKKKKAPRTATARGDWPAQNVSDWAIKDIKPYAKNPRTHPQDQITLLAEHMKRFGVDQPIVVDEDGVILKGHGRRMAAIEAGFKTYPVVVHKDLTEEEKDLVRVGDNQAALLSDWDPELIRLTVSDLQASGADLRLLGFPDTELKGFLQTDEKPPADPDDLPELAKDPVVRRGDVWVLGKHRIVCGDATDDKTWDAVFDAPTNERAAMVFTDPPYGVSYEASSGKFDVIQGDRKRRDDLYKMLLASISRMAGRTENLAAFYIWHASATRQDFTDAMKAAGLFERQYILWVKPSMALGHADYGWQHEPCFYASKGDRSPAFYGDRTNSTVWHVNIGGNQRNIAATVGTGVALLDGKGGMLYVQSKTPKNKKIRQIRLAADSSVFLSGSDRQDGTVWEVSRDGKHVHPTQKPVELARRAIENSSRPGEIVIDGFLGSGTTLIGCELTGRKCYGVELDPIYAEATIERWEAVAGRKAIKDLSGKTLEELRNEARHTGKSVRGKKRGGNRGERKVRQDGDAGLVIEGGVTAGEPSALAGNS
jgi:DNA modification methylase